MVGLDGLHHTEAPMPQLATPPQKQVICRGYNDYDALLNGAYIGSFPSATLTQIELDRLA
jgi:hypothetical protein